MCKITFDVPRVRENNLYPHSLENGLRSQRALILVLAEMYIQGVYARKVDAITEKLCGFEVSSTQISQATTQLDGQLGVWRKRQPDQSPYRWLDAYYEKVRHSLH